MKWAYILILFFALPFSNNLFAQNDCQFGERDTIVCLAIPEKILNSSDVNYIQNRNLIPNQVLKSSEKYVADFDSGIYRGQVYVESVFYNTNRADFPELSNSYLFTIIIRPSRMIRIKTAIAIDTIGNIVSTYGAPPKDWNAYLIPIMDQCDAVLLFSKNHPNTASAKFLEIKLDYDFKTQNYVWRLHKVKSSIVNDSGDRKGFDFKMTIDALTQEVIYDSKKKISIKH